MRPEERSHLFFDWAPNPPTPLKKDSGKQQQPTDDTDDTDDTDGLLLLLLLIFILNPQLGIPSWGSSIGDP